VCTQAERTYGNAVVYVWESTRMTELGDTKPVYIVTNPRNYGDWYVFDEPALAGVQAARFKTEVVHSTATLEEPWDGFRCWNVKRPTL
jgi:hypothetical protein